LVLIRTEFGKTIGGFSQYKWNKEYSGNYVNDTARQSCLLQLDLHEKMIPIHDQSLIMCKKTLGPTFGGGWDLSISDCCNKNNNSLVNLGHTYNNLRPERRYDFESQTTWTAICGNPSGKNFKVEEYEVFKVTWDKKE